MKIDKTEIDALNASIDITIEPEDYLEKLKTEYSKYKNKVQLRGFRKGKTPMSAIKKYYGKAIISDTINNLLSERLNEYIKEENLALLGQPIPTEDHPNIEFTTKEDASYTFSFDMGISPEFEVKGLDGELERIVVEIPDDMIQEEFEIARKRFGTEVFPEDNIEENDLITFKAIELDGDEPKENGWETGFQVLVKLTNDEVQKDLLEKKKGEQVKFNIWDLEKDRDEKFVKKHLLNLDEDEEKEIGSDFLGTIEKVSRIEPAELDEEFYKKYFGADTEINDEDSAKEKIKENLSQHYVEQTKNLLFKDIMDHLKGSNEIPLPDGFLRRWLKVSNENATDEVIDTEYKAFSDNLKWNLIMEKLEKKYEVEVKPEDIREGFKKRISAYFGGRAEGIDLDQMANNMMQNQEQFHQVYNEEKAEKLFQAISEDLKIEEKPMSLDDFRELVKKLNEETA